jgi:hypothetical protein
MYPARSPKLDPRAICAVCACGTAEDLDEHAVPLGAGDAEEERARLC